MMARTKLFLLWLLVLAIPVQGFAAVLQSGCASSHAMTLSMSGAMPMASDTARHSVAHMAPDMAMTMSDMPQDADALHHTASADPAVHHPNSTSSCSSCTVCTIGAILPLAPDQLLNLPLPTVTHIAMTAHGFVGYTPENPERPPAA